MPKLLGVIFDLDGTLVDSLADVRLALNGTIAAYDRRPLDLNEVRSMIGDGPQILLQRAFAATGAALSPGDAPGMVKNFIQKLQTQRASPEMLYPLVRETLLSLRQQNIKLGICTNKMYGPTLKLLSDIGITHLFDFIAGSDTFPVFKPDPGHVLGVAQGLGVPPHLCVMIGDSINDIRAAKGAKMPNIAISHGYGADIEALEADQIIGGFAELPQALRSLGFDFVA